MALQHLFLLAERFPCLQLAKRFHFHEDVLERQDLVLKLLRQTVVTKLANCGVNRRILVRLPVALNPCRTIESGRGGREERVATSTKLIQGTTTFQLRDYVSDILVA